jgi:hypothetical protein
MVSGSKRNETGHVFDTKRRRAARAERAVYFETGHLADKPAGALYEFEPKILPMVPQEW